ncbi:hypothetical protein NLI96_g1126 [Meripilus lineatus]|uniref:DUF1479-domain-containing protein n=1 Tax=Meripilus lineatus TaxID=2056292 RepID=A0AAD5YIP6_9APHY|nr:hypothetical protein NLI96_g1126 [Physisporinus lineatus]
MSSQPPLFGPCPPRFTEIKKDIANSYPDFQERITQAWNDLLDELNRTTKEIANQGSQAVPEVEFNELGKLSEKEIDTIQRKGCVVIRNVVDDDEASGWRKDLKEYVSSNPVEGSPPDDKQFFQLYWTKSQLQARSHPNVLQTQVWLNSMYHSRGDAKTDGVDLSVPLSYADRFRMRHPGNQWTVHPPHVDGGSIERWEDKVFRTCFADILSGNWRQHDPYDLDGRINARSSMYGRPNQSTIFRTYQGWLAFSETAPTEGTLKVFPNVILSNAYTIMRPFFRPKVAQDDPNLLIPENWEFGKSRPNHVAGLPEDGLLSDISHHDFPGIYSLGEGFIGPRPTTESHPHLRLDETMVSVPKVYPGDMVYWHCDLIHAVEVEHTGKEDSCVMYIPAVPYTSQNAAYVERQKDSFLKGVPPPDFPAWKGEHGFTGVGTTEDITSPIGKKAMGLAVEVA